MNQILSCTSSGSFGSFVCENAWDHLISTEWLNSQGVGSFIELDFKGDFGVTQLRIMQSQWSEKPCVNKEVKLTFSVHFTPVQQKCELEHEDGTFRKNEAWPRSGIVEECKRIIVAFGKPPNSAF